MLNPLQSTTMSAVGIGFVSELRVAHRVRTAIEKGRRRSNKIAATDNDLMAVPMVTSVVKKALPRNLQAKDINVKVTDHLDPASRERGDDFLLATRIAQDLEGHLYSLAGFTPLKEEATLVLDIVVTSAAVGDRNNRWNRCCDTGLVRLALSFSIHDETKADCPILKHGKVVYVEEASFQKRCKKQTGEGSMLSVLPAISRQLVNQVLPAASTSSFMTAQLS